MAIQRFTETFYLESAPSIDEDKGVLAGVKLLGLESRNGRRYKPGAVKEAVKLYKGKKIFLDHPQRESAGGDRSMRDWVGTIQNARFESDGIYGDVKLRTKSDHFAGIIEAARDFPNDVGFSHVADGESNYEGETEIVESIREVFSVDLVTDPATTGGFFESVGKPKPKTLKLAVESLPEGKFRTKLVEMMTDAGYMEPAGEAKENTDPLSQMAALLKTTIAMLGEALNTLAAKKDAAPPPAPPAPDAQEDDDMAAQDPNKKPADPNADPNAEKEKLAFESLKAKHAELEAKTMLLESGREPKPARIKALAAAPEADRKELLESWPVAESHEGGSIPFRSPALLTESAAGSADFPRDPAKFAALVR
jgi:hypothetical protein